MLSDEVLIRGGRILLDRERQAICRARRRAGVIPVLVEVPRSARDLLVRFDYLDPKASEDKRAVAAALSCFVADADSCQLCFRHRMSA